MNKMRRHEKECLDPALLAAYLTEATVMQLAVNGENGAPYIVPVHPVYHKNALYFHSANTGRKLELIRRNPLVGFAVNDMCLLRQSTETPCATGTAYKSVTGTAKAHFLEEEKNVILNLFIKKFTKHPETRFPRDMLAAVAVVRLEILSVSYKIDSKGL